jgi:hypothetical protein
MPNLLIWYGIEDHPRFQNYFDHFLFTIMQIAP